MIEFAKTQIIPVEKINPAPYNPRKELHPESRTAKQLLASMEAFGCVQPLVWNSRTGNLVGGHQRLKVMLAQGVKRAQVVTVDLPLEQEKQLNLSLNKIDGEWDNTLLADLLSELTALPEFEIDAIGFSSSEIDQLLADVIGDGPDEADSDMAQIESETDVPISRPGEIIELGEHRIACGDATDAEVYTALVGDLRAATLFTDPPYNVAYNTSNRPSSNSNKSSRAIANDKMTVEQYRVFTLA